MNFNSLYHTKLLAVFFLMLLQPDISIFGQTRQIPLTSPENRAVLENHESRAQSFVAKNLNRFGLEKLIDYDRALDSLSVAELKDTLDLLEKNYTTGSSRLLNDIASQENHIKELTAEKAKIEKQYSRLMKLSGLSFLGWLVIVLIFLQYQKRRVGKQELQLAKAEVQLKGMEDSAAKASVVIDQLKSSKNAFHKLREDSIQLQKICRDFADSPSSSAEWSQENVPIADKIATYAGSEFAMAHVVISQESEPGDEKQPTEINKLCEDVFEIARRGAGPTEEFPVQVTKDFEKNLPSIQINQPAVSNLLFNVLHNAYVSVKKRQQLGVKGYQAKVGISTRILPRFLQVRVRDNGVGMPESVLQLATNEFYSTEESNAGLGLWMSHHTMVDQHKGELRLESEDGNSADVYIKFFVK